MSNVKNNEKPVLKKLTASMENSKTSFKPLKVVTLIRNGERCDRLFPEWLTANINDADQYEPTDLNMPSTLWERPDGLSGYVDDTPLTEIGTMTCRMMGWSLKASALWPYHRIYCSPALRSVQSAAELASAFKSAVDVCVEPALFDFLGWYKTMPSLLSSIDLQRLKFPIYAEYNVQLSVEELAKEVGKETIDKFYARIDNALRSIVKRSEREHVIILSHAPVMDASIKSLLGYPPSYISEAQMLHMGTFYPYCSTITMAKCKDVGGMSITEDIPPYVQQLVRNKIFTLTALKITSITGDSNNEYEYTLEWYENPMTSTPITKTQLSASSSPTPATLRYTGSTSSGNSIGATRHSSWDRIVRDDTNIADDSDSRCSSCVII